MTDKIPVMVHRFRSVHQTASWPALGDDDKFIDADKIRYRIDPKTGEPLRVLPAHAVILNDDGSTGTEHWDDLLKERAAISGRLILSSFSKAAIEKFKTKA